MSYKKFTFSDLEEKFGLKQSAKHLFEKIVALKPTDLLVLQLEIAYENPLLSEKAICENIISPILVELKRKNKDSIQLFSGLDLPANKKVGLKGECDFLFAKAPQAREMTAPIISITEAKKGDIEAALSQNAAQMLGARIFNEKRKKNTPIIYGAVTNGTEWLFLKLEENTVFVDTKRYATVNLPELLGVLQTIINFYK